MRWTIADERVDVGMMDCSDSLKALVEGYAVRPRGYDWDGIVKDNVPGPYRPSSVDFILETEDSIYFIEFKGGNILRPEIMDNLRMKAVDTALVFDRFFPSDERVARCRRNLVIVYGNPRGSRSSCDSDISRVSQSMSRFPIRDVHGNRVYYDDVLLMTVHEFGLYLESRFPTGGDSAS